jgi:hypothetical protein
LPDIAKATFYHLAKVDNPDAKTFTLRLRKDIEAQALAQPRTADWLRRRIARELKTGLGRNVDLFGNLEVDDNDGLHVHGQFIVSDDEIERARECLRRAGGVWERNRRYQAHSHRDRVPDLGWPSYIGEELWKASGFLRDLGTRHGSPNLLVPYNGDPLFVSRDVSQRAKVLFNRLRWQLMRRQADRGNLRIQRSKWKIWRAKGSPAPLR